MQINVVGPVFQTFLFTILLLALAIFTSKKIKSSTSLSYSTTQELKGVAIFMVILAHTGYYLSFDTKFLFPLSIFGGVGVNLFLFLSGLGLTLSTLKNALNPIDFYSKRLSKLYLPLWVMLTLFISIEFLLFKNVIPINQVVSSYLGFFPEADIYLSFNSPLWYFTLIVFYYLIFPIFFYKKPTIFMVGIFTFFTILISSIKLPVTLDVQKLYQLHILAFPLGMIYALFIDKTSYLLKSAHLINLVENNETSKLRILILLGLVYSFFYLGLNAGVGGAIYIEQFLSLLGMFLLVLVFSIKNHQSLFFTKLGIYSYEIYLIQWPLMYRYDFLYKLLPVYMATFLYFALLIFFSISLRWLLNMLIRILNIKFTYKE